MKNYYELIKMLKNQVDINVLQTLKEDFNNDFCEELGKIQINNTTRKNAIKSYLNKENILQDNKYSNQLVFSDGYSILNIVSNPKTAEIFSADKKTDKMADIIIKSFQGMKPCEKYIKDSIAVARMLGWKPGTTDTKNPFIIEIEGNIYNFSLVYSLFSCIADNNNAFGGVDCFLCNMENNSKKSLLIRSKYGVALILPTVFDNFNPCKNVDFNAYIDHERNLENFIINGCTKTA